MKQESFKKNSVINTNNKNEVEFEKAKFGNFNFEQDSKKMSNDKNSINEKIINLQYNESLNSGKKLTEFNAENNNRNLEETENNRKNSSPIKKNLQIKTTNNVNEKDKKNPANVTNTNNNANNKNNLQKENSLDSQQSQEKVVRRRQSKYSSMLSKDIAVDDDMNDLLNRGISEITKNSLLSRNKCKNNFFVNSFLVNLIYYL